MYYENLYIKSVTDNKLFWKSVQPLLSDKSCTRDRITMSEKGEILKIESETAENLNHFFSSKESEYLEISEFDLATENIADPALKAIFKYKDHQAYFQYREIAKKKHFISQRLTLKN